MKMMKAVVTTGNGGFDKLEYKDVPVPEPGKGEVLVKVLAAGMNNTEINTRLGWYSSLITQSTETTDDTANPDDGGWNEETPFPFIQGTDCCGVVEAVGAGAEAVLQEKGIKGSSRILVRSCMRKNGFSCIDNSWMGSDFDGAFAQYVKVPASEIFPVNCSWSDAELATIPCAYGTAENMLHRSGLKEGEHVLVPGASGGVGSAVLQLAKRRGAVVTAVTSGFKTNDMKSLGADFVYSRQDNLMEICGKESFHLVVDNVGGEQFPARLKLLKRGGRFVSSGAIAGPCVGLDMRDMYLKDLRLIGTTAWDEPVFPNLISYIEKGEIKPLLAAVFPLSDIVKAQQEFLKKKHIGKMVLIP